MKAPSSFAADTGREPMALGGMRAEAGARKRGGRLREGGWSVNGEERVGLRTGMDNAMRWRGSPQRAEGGGLGVTGAAIELPA
ncbi:hypothetical protein CDD83_3995 [Cordyceps sp. RAO-2017]|nr:hypothetical protein CDD83_3995 [Cordyceps sp. RAO-2017]